MSSSSGVAQDAGGQEVAGLGSNGQSDMEGKSPAPSSHSMQVCFNQRIVFNVNRKSQE